MDTDQREMKERTLPAWDLTSPKEEELNRALLNRAVGKGRDLLHMILHDREIHQHHSYANAVSVRRLGYNDHGPVHARIVSYNALKILQLLTSNGILTSLENEEVASVEDSTVALLLGCFLHDVGMSVPTHYPLVDSDRRVFYLMQATSERAAVTGEIFVGPRSSR